MDPTEAQRWVPGEHDRRAIAECLSTAAGRALAAACAGRIEALRRRYENAPRLNPENCREDFRCLLGERFGVAFVPELIEACRRSLVVETKERGTG